MTDIIIKSFNRPYYLDRCLYSIYKYIAGDFKITILDDGTPTEYLDLIRSKYPNIDIILSSNHTTKSKLISEEKDIDGFSIPVDLWIDTVKKSSKYLIITEDDVWFTKSININELSKSMNKNNIHLLKLGWLGRSTPSNGVYNEVNIDDNVISSGIKLFTAPKFIINAIFFNKFKVYSLLYRLKIWNHQNINNYWALNSILMGMYNKEYWLKIWNNLNNKVDEKKQLYNSAVEYGKHKNNPHFISRLSHEAMKTTFISSATNSYHKYDINFDVNAFNKELNTAWFKGDFDALNNFPKDIAEDYIFALLEQQNNPKASASEWTKWKDKFKKQYRDTGVQVD